MRKLLSTGVWIGKVIFGVISWASVGAAIAGTAIGLYGMLCGIVIALIHGDPWRIISFGGYFALCGAAAGALVGGFARIIEEETPRSARPVNKKVRGRKADDVDGK